jgi:hypothetical protein
MGKITNVLPILPTGVMITERTAEIEMFQRSRSKYKPFIDTLKVIDSTKCVQMDVKGRNKSQISAVKSGIKGAAKNMGFKSLIKFSVKDDTLYIWSNR